MVGLVTIDHAQTPPDTAPPTAEVSRASLLDLFRDLYNGEEAVRTQLDAQPSEVVAPTSQPSAGGSGGNGHSCQLTICQKNQDGSSAAHLMSSA